MSQISDEPAISPEVDPGKPSLRKWGQPLLIWGLAIAAIARLWPGSWPRAELVVLASLQTLANGWQPSYDLLSGDGPGEDRRTAIQIVWSCYAVQVLALVEWVWRRPPLAFPSWWAWLGLGVAIGGLALRTWAVWTLGRFFHWHVAIAPDQPLVTGGPYRWIRHPSYSGAFMLFLGSCCWLGSGLAAVACLILLPLAFSRRIRLEEGLLVERLDGYRAYMERTGALWPRWPLHV
ncbi:MAG: isoprenylcysteine carboxylmethyltransferase family protein [bacterium]|nr:isoprenylcysteine carboxylmethyltransferase family protein [bacterium]